MEKKRELRNKFTHICSNNLSQIRYYYAKYMKNSYNLMSGTIIENSLASAGDAGDMGSIPELRKSSGIEMACSSILPWAEELGGLQSTGSKRVRHN